MRHVERTIGFKIKHEAIPSTTFQNLNVTHNEARHAATIVEQRWAHPEIQRTNEPLLRRGDAETLFHQFRLAILTAVVASRESWSGEEVYAIVDAALIHDSGKASDRAHEAELKINWTPEDRKDMETHIHAGLAFAAAAGIEGRALDYVATHHLYNVPIAERAARPYGIRGAVTPDQRATEVQHRLFAGLDALEAQLTGRVYHKPIPVETVLANMQRQLDLRKASKVISKLAQN